MFVFGVIFGPFFYFLAIAKVRTKKRCMKQCHAPLRFFLRVLRVILSFYASMLD